MKLNSVLKLAYATLFLGLVLLVSSSPAAAAPDPCCDNCYNTWSPLIDEYIAECDYDQSQDCIDTYGSDTCSELANNDCASGQDAYDGQNSCVAACGTCG